MTPRSLRRVSRVVHLIAAVALALLIYSPLGEQEAYLMAVRFGTFPVLTVTGLALWFGPRLIARRRRSAAVSKAG